MTPLLRAGPARYPASMWPLLSNAAANTPAPTEFEASARSFFMWMAIIALVVTWAWLYLRIRRRMRDPQADESGKSPD